MREYERPSYGVPCVPVMVAVLQWVKRHNQQQHKKESAAGAATRKTEEKSCEQHGGDKAGCASGMKDTCSAVSHGQNNFDVHFDSTTYGSSFIMSLVQNCCCSRIAPVEHIVRVGES